jgi:4-hydroxybutyrate CoA-transferase
MRFGIPTETGFAKGMVERRVALSPAGVRELCQSGAEVVLQQGTGQGAGFTDEEYRAAGARKTLHPGKALATLILGSRVLYRFVDNNPAFELHPSTYTNDPFVIAQNDNLIAINSALEIDLTGQVCADSIGTAIYSGFGGQLDFIRGAARSRGGKPIIALPATARGGEMSRIVPLLKPGAGVVTTRGDVHYVVTEFGVA